MTPFILPVTSLYAAINIAMLVVLAFVVVHYRIANQVELGAGGVERLERAIRAHGNLAEYLPVTLVLMALLEMNALPAWQLHFFGALFTAARLAHIHGITAGAPTSRSMGALFSVIVMISMIGMLAKLALFG